jgi:lipopolysaccharide export system protein LptA
MGDHKAFVDVKAQTVVIDEPRGLSTYTGNAEVTKGSLFFMKALQVDFKFNTLIAVLSFLGNHFILLNIMYLCMILQMVI